MTNDFTDESEFRSAVETILAELLSIVDEIDSDDHDPSMTAGYLKVVFEDGSTFILSQQPPTRELWLSANFTAWHFICSEGIWRERDAKTPMREVLSALFSEKLGMDVCFSR